MSEQRFVIVGGGLAGADAAATLRTEGFDGSVVLIGEEQERPYERPPLSKEYLRGEKEMEKVYVHPADFYRDHDIELLLGRKVIDLDVHRAEIATEDGETLGYDRLLIATGSSARRLSLPGADLEGVVYLRVREDSDRLRKAISSADRVVVVGGGWIGSEVAASARMMGAGVAMVEAAPVPLAHVVGEDLGGFFRDLHSGHDVDLHLGTMVEEFVGDDRVEGVRVPGEVIAGDLVVVGAGARPRLELAEAGGLTIDDGILVDEFLASSAEGVYAAGDVANAFHPRYRRRLRVEHWSNARHQGRVAAKNMLGQPTPYDRVPYFFSDQYDMGLEYSGVGTDDDQIVIRGDVAEGEFVAFWTRDGRVMAGMNVNVWDVADTIQEMIRSGEQVDLDRLIDPDVSLEALTS